MEPNRSILTNVILEKNVRGQDSDTHSTISVASFNTVEYNIEGAGQDSSCSFFCASLNGICLAGVCYSIRKEKCVLTKQHVFDKR